MVHMDTDKISYVYLWYGTLKECTCPSISHLFFLVVEFRGRKFLYIHVHEPLSKNADDVICVKSPSITYDYQKQVEKHSLSPHFNKIDTLDTLTS
jgi:hypothetical protein